MHHIGYLYEGLRVFNYSRSIINTWVTICEPNFAYTSHFLSQADCYSGRQNLAVVGSQIISDKRIVILMTHYTHQYRTRFLST